MTSSPSLDDACETPACPPEELLIDAEAEDSAQEISRLWREDPEALVAYNREDARLVIDLLEHEGLIDLAVERSLLSGMPLDRVGASVASFDRLYLPELRRRGFVAPSVDAERKTELVRGGALLDPQPGVFRNVAVFDWKSLYPSLIRTFQLDPLAHAEASHRVIEAGKHVYSEKPLAATFAEGRELAAAAQAKGVRIGCARTPSSARGTRRCATPSTRVRLAVWWAVPSASPARAWRAGIPTRPSSSSAAAAPCSTSAAIRSPSSSTASAPSPV